MSETTIIALAAVVISFLGLVFNTSRNNRNDSEQHAKEASDRERKYANDRDEINKSLVGIQTSQEFMANDMKDMKADFRSFQKDLQDVRATATMALASANKANERLDNIDGGV